MSGRGVGGLWHHAASDCSSPAPACFSSWELISTSCRKPELESVVQLSLFKNMDCFFFFNHVYVFICSGTSLVGHSNGENNNVTREQLQVGHRCRKHLQALCHPSRRGCAAASPGTGGRWQWVRVSSQLLQSCKWILAAFDQLCHEILGNMFLSQLLWMFFLWGGGGWMDTCAELLLVGPCFAGRAGCRWEVRTCCS